MTFRSPKPIRLTTIGELRKYGSHRFDEISNAPVTDASLRISKLTSLVQRPRHVEKITGRSLSKYRPNVQTFIGCTRTTPRRCQKLATVIDHDSGPLFSHAMRTNTISRKICLLASSVSAVVPNEGQQYSCSQPPSPQDPEQIKKYTVLAHLKSSQDFVVTI